jgi:hypothetical protein
MRVQTGQMVPLGYGKYVLSDEVVAIEPLSEGRGPGRRTTVWVRGLSDALIASRSEEAIVDDLVTPADETARLRQQRTVLQQVLKTLDSLPPYLRRVLREENGIDFDAVASDVRRVLG